MTRGRVARRLLRLLRPLAPLMTVSAVARVLNQGMGVAIPAVAAALMLDFVDGSALGPYILVLAAMALVKGTFRYVEQFTGHAVAFRLLSELRVDTYRKIVPLAPAGLEDERTGDLVARVVGDIDRVEPFYAHTIAPLVSGILVPVLASIGLALWVDPLVAIVFIPFPILMVGAVPWIKASRVGALSTASREQGGETAAVFTDIVQGAREVAVFDARDTAVGRVNEQSSEASVTRRALSRISATRSSLNDFLAGGAVVVVAAVALSRFNSGLIELAALAAAIVVGWVGTTPARAVENIALDLEQALAAAKRLFDLSDRKPTVHPPVNPVGAPGDGSVAFRGVTVLFGDSSHEALEDVEVTVPDKSYTAIVGPSGSGKSTFVDMLARFRDPDQGRVEIGGVDVRDIGPSDLAKTITLVPQRSEIFFGTVGHNLRLASPDATREELWEALDRAALGSWAGSLEGGLETTTGELGETLSGGQRQRLAIARAFLRDPRVLVLDEATSELDVETERLVLDEIARERGRRTVLVVAHRLESVMDADQILVLDNGRLVETGSHEELVSAGGVYSGLWQRHLDVVVDGV